MRRQYDVEEEDEVLKEIFKDCDTWDESEDECDDETEEEREERVSKYYEDLERKEQQQKKRRYGMTILFFVIVGLLVSIYYIMCSDSTNVVKCIPEESANTCPYDSCMIKHCVNAKTGEMKTVGKLYYYVSGDTLFMSEHFHFVGMLYSDTEGNLDISGRAQSPVIHEGDKKGDWWFAVIKRSTLLPEDYKVTGIVCRCLYVENERETHIASDAYLYNVTKGVSRDKTIGEPTKSIQKLLPQLNR